MIIDKIGIYEFTEDVTLRTGSHSIATFPKGMVFGIDQIDKVNHKCIGVALEDWTHWDLPVKPYISEDKLSF